MKKTIIFVLILPALLFLWRGCYSPILVAEPFEAWVVDAETGAPIEGAIVVAEWSLYEATGHGHRFQEMVDIREAVTDKNGRFAFTGFTIHNWNIYELENGPRVIIFKSGYEYRVRKAACGSSGGDCPWARRIASVAGERVALKKLDYIAAQTKPNGARSELYSGLDIMLDDVFKSCNLRKIPLFLIALDEEKKRLVQTGFSGYVGFPSADKVNRHLSYCEAEKKAIKGKQK